MWITGPWNLGEFRRRLTPDQQDLWMTAPLPAPDDDPGWPGYSLAGGSSLAIFRASENKDAAWAFAEYLSEPAVQSRFYTLSGDLPARREAWDEPSLANDRKARAFRVQLSRVEPMPRVPEWEQIAQQIAEEMEPAIRGRAPVTAVLATLDADVDRILEKRRWILARNRGPPCALTRSPARRRTRCGRPGCCSRRAWRPSRSCSSSRSRRPSCCP